MGHRPPLCQIDRETAQRWMHRGALSWALLNGSALGVGAASRLGFPLWYVVPVTALLGGSPILGAAVYGAYGFVRAGATFALLLGGRWVDGTVMTERLLRGYAPVRIALAAHLTAVSTAALVVAGP